MNERIKELAEQACDATAVSPDFGHPVSFAEKFAELLIFDILNVITNDDALGPARINTLRRISDRYGVQRKMN